MPGMLVKSGALVYNWWTKKGVAGGTQVRVRENLSGIGSRGDLQPRSRTVRRQPVGRLRGVGLPELRAQDCVHSGGAARCRILAPSARPATRAMPEARYALALPLPELRHRMVQSDLLLG